MFKKMPVRKSTKIKKPWRWILAMSKAEYAKLAKIVERCYRDGVLTQREVNTLMKVSERIEEIKANEEKAWRNPEPKGKKCTKTSKK